MLVADVSDSAEVAFWRGDGAWATPAGGGTVTHTAGALTFNSPVLGNGGADVAVGTTQGSTTRFVTYAGSSPAANDCAKFDANGNLTTNGVACGTGGGGSGTVTSIATSGPLSGGTITTTGALSCPTCTTNSAAATVNAIMLGSGSQAISALGSLGTPTTVLHGNTTGAPTFGAVSLAVMMGQDLGHFGKAVVASPLDFLCDLQMQRSARFAQQTLIEGVTHQRVFERIIA